MSDSEAPVATPRLFGIRIQIAFWMMLFCVNVYVGSFLLGWQDAFYRSALNVFCHALNFYGLYSWVIPFYYEKRRYGLAIVSVIGVLLVLTPFRLLIEANYPLLPNSDILPAPGARVGFVLFTEVAIAAFASLTRLAGDNERRKQQISTLEKAHLESELRFLKAQMNPHFLFNTINNIYSLTLLKSDRAAEALLKLSSMLRYLLYETRAQVTLEKEYQALELFKELFQLKSFKPLNIKIDLRADAALLIEPLILIPILENAVKHSGLAVVPDAFVEFCLYQEGGKLVVESTNSVSDAVVETDARGIGLDNIRKRLSLAYPDTHHLAIKKTEQLFTLLLTIEIPGA